MPAQPPALRPLASDFWTTADGQVSIAIDPDGRYSVSSERRGWIASVRTLSMAALVASWQ